MLIGTMRKNSVQSRLCQIAASTFGLWNSST